jgi:hypothetical protein
MSDRHRWRDVVDPDGVVIMRSCVKCGASRRGKGDKLQFILPYRKNAQGDQLGWTPPASFTPPCSVPRI